MNLFVETIPGDTVRAALRSSPENQRYILVGDQIHTILAGMDLGQVALSPEKPRSFAVLLMLVTLFQYVEKLTDPQAAEAVRTRVEWKYALHLPLSYPGFDPIWLCRLRKYTLGSALGMASVQNLATRLVKIGMLEGSPEARRVVLTICQLNRIELVARSMLLAVEALAVRNSAWLNQLPLAYLYEEYARIMRLLRELKTPEASMKMANMIGVDIHNLLHSLEASGEKDLMDLPEISILEMVWDSQYERLHPGRTDDQIFKWSAVDCQGCKLDSNSGDRLPL